MPVTPRQFLAGVAKDAPYAPSWCPPHIRQMSMSVMPCRRDCLQSCWSTGSTTRSSTPAPPSSPTPRSPCGSAQWLAAATPRCLPPLAPTPRSPSMDPHIRSSRLPPPAARWIAVRRHDNLMVTIAARGLDPPRSRSSRSQTPPPASLARNPSIREGASLPRGSSRSPLVRARRISVATVRRLLLAPEKGLSRTVWNFGGGSVIDDYAAATIAASMVGA